MMRWRWPACGWRRWRVAYTRVLQF